MTTRVFYAVDNVGDDCPVFDGLFDYCAISAGGSMGMLFCVPFVSKWTINKSVRVQRVLLD